MKIHRIKIVIFLIFTLVCFASCTNTEIQPARSNTASSNVSSASDNENTARLMTSQELFEFVDFIRTKTQYCVLINRTMGYDHKLFEQFVNALPEIAPEICRSVTDDESQMLREKGYYFYSVFRRNYDDVSDVWAKYVTENTKLEKKTGKYVYIDESTNTVYASNNCRDNITAVTGGEILGDYAALLFSDGTIAEFKYENNTWKIYTIKRSSNEINYIEKYQRLTGDELYELGKQQPSLPSDLYDGYRDGDYYYIYSDWTLYYVKREDNSYKIVAGIKLNTNREKNIFVDEGRVTGIQYVLSDVFIPHDETKGLKWNQAIDAYNNYFLNDIKIENGTGRKDYLASLNSSSLHYSKWDSYLRDLNNDDIPELMISIDFLYPCRVYTVSDGTVKIIVGAQSNGQSGDCALIGNVYVSNTGLTNWQSSYVTYNKDGTQTVVRFNEYPEAYYYEKRIVSENSYKDIESMSWEKTEEGQRQFEEKQAPYKKIYDDYVANNYSDGIEKVWYSPFEIDTSLNYSPYVLERINRITESDK